MCSSSSTAARVVSVRSAAVAFGFYPARGGNVSVTTWLLSFPGPILGPLLLIYCIVKLDDGIVFDSIKHFRDGHQYFSALYVVILTLLDPSTSSIIHSKGALSISIALIVAATLGFVLASRHKLRE